MSEEMLVFIDPGYLDGIGHYENYAIRLREGAKKRNTIFRHFVNLKVPKKAVRQHHLEPLFPYRPLMGADVYRDPDRLAHYIDTFAAKLQQIVRHVVCSTPPDCRIRLLMYTGHPRLLPVIAESMVNENVSRRDIIFCFNIFYVSNAFVTRSGGNEYALLTKEIGRVLESIDSAGQVRLFADSVRIKNAYSRYFSRPISLLPIPLGGTPLPLVDEGWTAETVTLGYLGYTHAKQGYPFILQLYHDLRKHREYRHVHLKVRHNIFNIQGTNIAVLRELVGSSDRIENTINYQSPGAYESFLKECDILLIPHSRLHYPVQTSGMLIDAICHGKPVVVPENTWLADQMTEHGAGETFSGANYESFRDAVFKAIENAPELRAQGVRRVASFVSFHSPETLLETVFAKPLSAVPEPVPACSAVEDCAELLGLDLLDRYPAVTELVYAEKMDTRKNLGWHYLLDLVWITAQLQSLPPGSLVLDAGAGNGLLQYVLMRRGLRVISVDFVARRGPVDRRWIAISAGEVFDNAYLRHLRENYSIASLGDGEERVVASPEEMVRILAREDVQLIIYRSDLAAMKLLPDRLVDAVVSVSALEHNDFNATARAVTECLRVLKPGGKMLATVAAAEHEDWFHAPSKGWCYSLPTLRRLFQLQDGAASNFDAYRRIHKELDTPGNELQIQLAPFYFDSGRNGMPWGRWKPAYLPVGVRKIKALG